MCFACTQRNTGESVPARSVKIHPAPLAKKARTYAACRRDSCEQNYPIREMQREDAPAKNLHRIIWAANKDWGWIQISNLFELSNLHRTLNFRTYSGMKYRKSENCWINFGENPENNWSKFSKLQQSYLSKLQQTPGKFCNKLKKKTRKNFSNFNEKI